jgi:superfamily II DNA/RNA helicase
LLCKKKGIVFVNSIKDADKLKQLIENELDIPSFAIHSKVNNNAIIEFKKCPMAVAIAVRKLRVGFDDAAVNYVIDLQNPQNADIFTQIVGRVMRVTLLDPTKIGYVIAFHDPNTRNFKVTTDAIALERASEIYKFKQLAMHTFKKYATKFGRLTSTMSTNVTKNTNDMLKKMLKFEKLNQFLNKFDCLCSEFFIDYKKILKQIFEKKERQHFKCADSLSLALRKLENEHLPFNQSFYIEDNKENKSYVVSDFCKSMTMIHKELDALCQNERISINKTLQSKF